jgi:hypothetical protein
VITVNTILHVNGTTHQLSLDPRLTLLDTLRDVIGLTGTKKGCDQVGMALLEETVSDRTGRLVTTSLAEYVVAVNADVRDVDVLFVGEPDAMTPLGTKGVGELATTGMPAAIANAVYHATGNRVRSLPIAIEKVLGYEQGA